MLYFNQKRANLIYLLPKKLYFSRLYFNHSHWNFKNNHKK